MTARGAQPGGRDLLRPLPPSDRSQARNEAEGEQRGQAGSETSHVPAGPGAFSHRASGQPVAPGAPMSSPQPTTSAVQLVGDEIARPAQQGRARPRSSYAVKLIRPPAARSFTAAGVRPLDRQPATQRSETRHPGGAAGALGKERRDSEWFEASHLAPGRVRPKPGPAGTWLVSGSVWLSGATAAKCSAHRREPHVRVPTPRRFGGLAARALLFTASALTWAGCAAPGARRAPLDAGYFLDQLCKSVYAAPIEGRPALLQLYPECVKWTP